MCMSLSIVFLLPQRQKNKGISLDVSLHAVDASTTTNTNRGSRIVMNAYSGLSNGHVAYDIDGQGESNPVYDAHD